jgi:hypothetical protein
MVQAGEVQGLLEIARKMDISADMALQMAKELTDMGYLQEMDADCQEPERRCSDCPVNNTCQVIVRHWFLTEKGRNAVSSLSMTES